MSSATESARELFPVLRLPTNFEDNDEDDEILQQLALEMEVEVLSSLYADEEDQFEEMQTPESPFATEMEIRSLIQLPGDRTNSVVWVHTKTGRRAKIILEAQDESENVGLLEYEDHSQEIRRLDSYADQNKMTSEIPPIRRVDTPQIRRLDTLTIPNLGGARLPSMRDGKNPFFDPREAGLVQSPCSLPNFPSYRAGKNPHFNPSGAVFF